MSDFFNIDDIDYFHTGEVVAAINEGLNDGRGISAIHDIASALQRGDIQSAKATIFGEWDKVSSHSQVAEYLVAQGLFTPVDFSSYFQE